MWYPRCSKKLVSAKLYGLQDFRPPEMIRLLTNVGLRYLYIGSDRLVLDQKSLEKLVSSQIKTLKLNILYTISGLRQDSLPDVNVTLKNLYLSTSMISHEESALFPKCFLGLVNLSIVYATDSILQNIFETQVGTDKYSLFILEQNGCKRNLWKCICCINS